MAVHPEHAWLGGLNTPDLRRDPDNPKPAEKLRPDGEITPAGIHVGDVKVLKTVSTEPSSKRIHSPERSRLSLSDIKL
jgi:hypothetical protein